METLKSKFGKSQICFQMKYKFIYKINNVRKQIDVYELSGF